MDLLAQDLAARAKAERLIVANIARARHTLVRRRRASTRGGGGGREAAAAEADAKRRGERERRAAERREMVATREHEIAEDEKDRAAAIRIDAAARSRGPRLLAAERTARGAGADSASPL